MAKTKLSPAEWSRAPETLVKWLKGYQRKRGLKIDGIPGRETIDQLRLDDLSRRQPDDPGPIDPPPGQPPMPSLKVFGIIVVVITGAVLAFIF